MSVGNVSRARGGRPSISSRRSGTGRVPASPALALPQALEPDLDPEELTAAVEASLLRAGMAAYYAVLDGALALLNHAPLGQYVNARV